MGLIITNKIRIGIKNWERNFNCLNISWDLSLFPMNKKSCTISAMSNPHGKWICWLIINPMIPMEKKQIIWSTLE